MNRRNFLKIFGTATISTIVIPAGISITKKYIPESYNLCMGDIIIFPHKDGFDEFGIYYINSLFEENSSNRIHVIAIDKVSLNTQCLTPVEGDVFLHFDIGQKSKSNLNNYIHYEELFTHELYEIIDIIEQDHFMGEYIFNYRLS